MPYWKHCISRVALRLLASPSLPTFCHKLFWFQSISCLHICFLNLSRSETKPIGLGFGSSPLEKQLQLKLRKDVGCSQCGKCPYYSRKYHYHYFISCVHVPCVYVFLCFYKLGCMYGSMNTTGWCRVSSWYPTLAFLSHSHWIWRSSLGKD